MLLQRHGGDYQKVLDHVVVRRLVVSEKDRVGIGTFMPKDEKNQDSTELTGDVNYRRIAELGDLWPKVPAHLRTQVAREVERLYLLVHQLGTRPSLEAEDGC
jgi:hypothetical protein